MLGVWDSLFERNISELGNGLIDVDVSCPLEMEA